MSYEKSLSQQLLHFMYMYTERVKIKSTLASFLTQFIAS